MFQVSTDTMITCPNHPHAMGDILGPNDGTYLYLALAAVDTLSLTMRFDFARGHLFSEKYIDATFYRLDSTNQNFRIQID